jgi:predicted nucleic acid-binding protein
MKSSWRNVAGQFSIEIYVHDQMVLDIEEKERPVLNPQRLYFDAEDVAELIIDFTSTGYEDSGSMYGGPDDLGWPPEGDEERFLETAYLLLEGVKIILSKEQQQTLFELYIDEIEAVELECQEA